MSLLIFQFCLFFSHVISSALFSGLFNNCEIWGSHAAGCGEFCLLGCNIV